MTCQTCAPFPTSNHINHVNNKEISKNKSYFEENNNGENFVKLLLVDKLICKRKNAHGNFCEKRLIVNQISTRDLAFLSKEGISKERHHYKTLSSLGAIACVLRQSLISKRLTNNRK